MTTKPKQTPIPIEWQEAQFNLCIVLDKTSRISRNEIAWCERMMRKWRSVAGVFEFYRRQHDSLTRCIKLASSKDSTNLNQ